MRKRWMQAAVAGVVVMLAAGASQARREGMWTMELKHLGLEHVILETKTGPEVVYYVVYEVINNTGDTRTVNPQARIVTETGQTLYATPNPGAVAVISKKRGRELLDVTEMAQEKIANGESRHGVMVFTGLDDNADHVEVTIYGLSSEYKYQDEKARTGYMEKVYQMKLFRPGDEIDRQADKVTVEEEGWTWLAVPGEKVAAAAETPASAPAPAAPATPAPAAPAE